MTGAKQIKNENNAISRGERHVHEAYPSGMAVLLIGMVMGLGILDKGVEDAQYQVICNSGWMDGAPSVLLGKAQIV